MMATLSWMGSSELRQALTAVSNCRIHQTYQSDFKVDQPIMISVKDALNGTRVDTYIRMARPSNHNLGYYRTVSAGL